MLNPLEQSINQTLLSVYSEACKSLDIPADQRDLFHDIISFNQFAPAIVQNSLSQLHLLALLPLVRQIMIELVNSISYIWDEPERESLIDRCLEAIDSTADHFPPPSNSISAPIYPSD